MLRRARFGSVIDAQLDLFIEENREVIDEVRERLNTYSHASRDEAEELYGDYLDAIETGTEILAHLRDRYAATVDDPERYLLEFDRAVRRRLPSFAPEIENH